MSQWLSLTALASLRLAPVFGWLQKVFRIAPEQTGFVPPDARLPMPGQFDRRPVGGISDLQEKLDCAGHRQQLVFTRLRRPTLSLGR